MNFQTIFPLAQIKTIFKRPLTLMVAMLCTLSVWGTQIPERPKPARLVNDMANMLSSAEVQALEQNLVQYSRSTSTQIVVVTTSTLNGMDKAMYATELGHKWGVGQADKDNGIVILIKEKTASQRGDVFIAVGYGLEGVIPDAIAKRIVEYEIIPRFKQGDYYGGIAHAVTTLEQLALGEFSAREYQEKTKQKKTSPGGILVPILLFFFFFGNIFSRANRLRRNSLGRGLSFWMLLSLLGSGSRSSGGGFGNFSSGGGSFGGFGGGGFGGGGAGGSW